MLVGNCELLLIVSVGIILILNVVVPVSSTKEKNLCEIQKVCKNGGTCFSNRNIMNSFTCRCRRGFSGTLCEELDPCQLSISKCGANQKCQQLDENRTECVFLTPCASSPCFYEGQCEVVGNGTDFLCRCAASRYGRRCELEKFEKPCETQVSDICLNGGICYSTNLEPNEYKCHCFSGICKNNSTCVSNGEFDYRCICTNGWAGEDCTFRTMSHLRPRKEFSPQIGRKGGDGIGIRTEPIIGRVVAAAPEDFCLTIFATSCQNGGICVKSTSADFNCDCPVDYTGKTCADKVVDNACNSQPCLHGGLCILLIDGSFTCDCPREYLGKFCALT